MNKQQINLVYANEADVLNMALYGMTDKQWRDQYLDKEGNIRDYSNVAQLVCLANLENLNAVWIEEGLSQSDRLQRLNQVAIQQMQLLTQDIPKQKLKEGNDE